MRDANSLGAPVDEWLSLAPSRPSPARAGAANIDVRERSVSLGCSVQRGAAHELRVRALHAFDGLHDHSHVARVDALVAVQIVHSSVAVIVHEHVRGIAELMAAVTRSP